MITDPATWAPGAWTLASALFAAGGFYAAVRAQLKHLERRLELIESRLQAIENRLFEYVARK